MPLQRIEDKVDKLDGRLDKIEVTLARNTVSLEHHIKRTDALETRVESVLPRLMWALSILSAIVVLAKQFT